MKTYRNEQYGFEIDIPEEWSLHTGSQPNRPSSKDSSLIFRCRPNEAFNFQIGALTSEYSLNQTENEFNQYAQEKGYTSLAFGRLVVEGKELVWARYYTGGGLWSKKYMIVLNGIEYVITATCMDQKLLLDMEKVWDAVVGSFRLIAPAVKTAGPKREVSERKNEIADKYVAEIRNAEPQVLSKSNIRGMKTYKNDELGIEINVPERWLLPAREARHTQFGEEITFGCGANEAFYIIIIPSVSESSLEQTELKFREFALEKGYTNLVFGRVTFGNSEYVCVQYDMTGILWVRKYLIFLGGTKYEITASCTEYSSDRKIFEHKKKIWDSVVASFRVLKPIDDTLGHKYEVSEQMGRSTDNSGTGFVNVGIQNVTVKSMKGKKTYRNEKHSFEIDIPEEWAPAPALLYEFTKIISRSIAKKVGKDVFQYGWYGEAFNFEIGPLFPEPLLDDTEIEFRLYARNMDFMDLHFGRVTVGGKEHVCAHYFINDKMGKRWNKKYMIVFGGTEYTITGTCNDPQYFTKREKDWDSIIQSFRLLKPVDDSANFTDKAERYKNQRREIIQQRIDMRELTGDLYARAYEAVALGQFKEARTLLEKCLQENPDHVLAHKELAVVLEKLGDIKGALHHRMEAKRLAPDDIVNRSRLDGLLAGSGKRSEALQEVRESLKRMPGNPVLRDLEKKLMQSQFGNYKMTFYSSLVCLLLADISFFFPEYIAISNVWCMSLLMLMPTWGVWVSGPWLGIPKTVSGLIAGMFYLFFLIHAW